MRHFFLRDHHGFPVACIASIIATPKSGSDNRYDDGPLEPDSMVAFTVAVHNPKDTYDKARGRHIAEARLEKRKNLHFVNPKPNIKANIMSYIALDVMMHPRVRLAAAHWLLEMDSKSRASAMLDAEIAFDEADIADERETKRIASSAPIPCNEALDAYATPPMGIASPEEIAEQMATTINQEPEAHFLVDAALATDEDGHAIVTPTPEPQFDEYGDEGDDTTHATMRDGLSGTALEALMAEHPPENPVPWTWGGSNVESA